MLTIWEQRKICELKGPEKPGRLRLKLLTGMKFRRKAMDLDDRKAKILRAIIRNYQETGEPVGSRTISKYSDLSLSSATIRNEMAD